MLSNKGNRLAAAAVITLLLLPLSSCFAQKSQNTGEAMLLAPGGSQTNQAANVVTAELGTISRSATGEGSISYPLSRKITTNYKNARLLSIHVKRGDTVKKGDIIAEFEIEYDQSEYNSLKSDLDIALKQYDLSKSGYQSTISSAQSTLASLREQDRKTPSSALKVSIAKAEIGLKKAQSAYEFFQYDQQRTISKLRSIIGEYEAKISDNKIVAPFDGVIKTAEYLPAGNIIDAGTEICTMYSGDIVWVSTTSDVSNGMRYNSAATISVSVVNDTYTGRIITAPDVSNESTGAVVVMPDDVIDIDPGDRMRRLSVSTARYELDNVVILPSAAVYNEDGKRYVYLYENGIMKKRYVTIGLSATNTVQILEGLTAGQKVVMD